VFLRGQLLRAQFVGGDYLFGERFCVVETKGHQRYFCDHGLVWHHHCHGTEQHLEIIGQLRATCLPRVHRNEAVTGLLQHKIVGTLEVETGFALRLRQIDLLQLLRYDRKHL
jgi:hypothetical protein